MRDLRRTRMLRDAAGTRLRDARAARSRADPAGEALRAGVAIHARRSPSASITAAREGTNVPRARTDAALPASPVYC